MTPIIRPGSRGLSLAGVLRMPGVPRTSPEEREDAHVAGATVRPGRAGVRHVVHRRRAVRNDGVHDALGDPATEAQDHAAVTVDGLAGPFTAS